MPHRIDRTFSLHIDIGLLTVLPKHKVLAESRIPLKPVLIELLSCSLNLMNRLDEIESAVFKICRSVNVLKFQTLVAWQKDQELKTNSTDPNQAVSEIV